MKAVFIEAYGGREKLQVGELPMPEVLENDVLIEVYASSVNPVDWKIREGHLSQRIAYEFPLILGWDVAGVVQKIGQKVTLFHVGDEVFSRPDIARNGTYAEYVSVDESLVALKPENLTFEEAASVPLAGLTAWQALVDVAKVKSGYRVLIHAGAGGVGAYAIQLAKSFGCHVTTTVSAKNVEFVNSLGANQVLDYSKEDFSARLDRFDVVFDTIGGAVQQKSFDVLKEGGILVSIVSPPDVHLAKEKHVRAEFLFLNPDGKQLAQLARLLATGEVRPVVGRVFPLEETAKAHELSESHHARGKIVLKVK